MESGVGWRWDNFSQEDMTPWDPFGFAGRANKVLHPIGTPLEKNRQKITIFGQGRPRSFIKPHWGSEVQNGIKHVLWTLNHPL